MDSNLSPEVVQLHRILVVFLSLCSQISDRMLSSRSQRGLLQFYANLRTRVSVIK